MTALPHGPHEPADQTTPPLQPAPPTRLTARCPEDVLALVPVLLGFYPADSVAMLTFGAAQPFHARVDLPSSPWTTGQLDEVVAGLLDPVRCHGVRRVVLVVYTDDPRLASRTARRLLRAFAREGVEVPEMLRADGSRWWPLVGRDRGAPDHGVPYDVSAHPFLVQSVLAGQVTHGARSDLSAGLVPDPRRAAAVARLVAEQDAGHGAGMGHDAEQDRSLLAEGEWVEGLVRVHAGAGTSPADHDVARLLRALRATVLRDAAWSVLTRPGAPDHVRFWTDVLRRAPDDLAAPPAALLGWAAWQSGDGALAWCAVEAAEAADPDYRLTGYLAAVLERAVPPSAWSPSMDWRLCVVDSRT